MANYTLLFKDIFSNYEEFISFSDIEILLTRVSSIEETDWLEDTFYILQRRYKFFEICYNNEEPFINKLAEVIEINAPNYYSRKTLYNRLLKLDDTELKDRGFSILNVVEHNDTEIDKPLDNVLKQISSQQSNKTNAGTVEALRSQLYNLQMRIMDEYLNKFKFLFIALAPYPSISRY